MNRWPISCTLLLASILAWQPSAHGSTATSANYSIAASSIDIGGTPSSSANYANAASLGAITGLTTVSSPAESMKAGYLGQLYQVTGLALAPIFNSTAATQQLQATQTLDDGTMMALIGNFQSWSLIDGQLPDGLTLNTSSGVISGTPTGPRSYSFIILVTDGLGNSAQQTFSPPQTLALWEAQYPQLYDLSPTATPRNDGVDNLLKYLFDINPSVAMSPSDQKAMPSVGMTGVGGTTYLTLTYRENSFVGGITVNVQTTTDFVTWQTVTPDLSHTIGTDPSTGDPIVQIGVKPTDLTQEFIRLYVTQP